MKLPLVYAPHDILTAPARVVAHVDKKIKKIIKDMADTLLSCKNPQGVGLAAVQVGTPLRIFITKPTNKSEVWVFINPVIIKLAHKKKSTKESLEGCLSVKNRWAAIDRFETVELEYTTLDNKRVKEVFTGYHAHIVQHEVDHLEGTLFTYRALEQKKKLYALTREENGEEKLTPLSF